MHTRYHLPKEFYHLVKPKPIQLSSLGSYRLNTLITWQVLRDAGLSTKRAIRKLGMRRAALYRWQKRINDKGTSGLETSSPRPKHFCTVRWSVELIEIVLELRKRYPRWGKEKLCVLLGREGQHTSASTVRRKLCYLKKRELIHDPPRTVKLGIKRHKKRPFALRKPKNYCIEQPGGVQVLAATHF